MPAQTDHELYRQFLDHCDPYRLPPPWDFLEATGIAYVLPARIAEVLAILAEQFGPEALVDEGIAVISESGLELSATLTRCDGTLVPILDSETGQIVDLVTSSGCVSGIAVPMFGPSNDPDVLAELANARTNVFVAFFMADFVLILALGLPVTLANDSIDWSKDGIAAVCEWLEEDCEWVPKVDPLETETFFGPALPKSAPATPKSEALREIEALIASCAVHRISCLVFVGCSLSDFQPVVPSQYLALQASIHGRSSELDLNLRSLLGMVPTDELQNLRLLLNQQDPCSVRRWILDQSDAADLLVMPDVPQTPPPAPPPADYLQAREWYRAQLRTTVDPPTGDERRRLRLELEQLHYDHFLRPLIQEAVHNPNPTAASLQLLQAGLFQTLHSQTLHVSELTSAAFVRSPGQTVKFSDEVDGIVTITDLILKIQREIRADRDPHSSGRRFGAR